MTETPASAVTFDCVTLRAVAVQQANPAWFVSLPAPLVQRARASALGSRMLAWVLAEGIAPALFAEPAWKMPANADWLFWPKSALDEVALDFAALALSASIRATVKRDAVLRLKRVLSEPRYALALNEPTASLDARGFSTALAADESLAQYLSTQGYAELIGYAATLHPACAERIRLSLPPGEIPVRSRRLDSARVTAHFEQLRAANEAAKAAQEQVANG